MNFLGLRLCDHDSSITYTVDDKVWYYKHERDLQQKHYAPRDLTSWAHSLERYSYCRTGETFDPKDVDAIGIVLDCHMYPRIQTDEKKLVEQIEIPVFRDIGYDCPIYRIDHHYAHMLSAWPLGIESDVNFVYDGFGDDKITFTAYHGDERFQRYTTNDAPSFGGVLGDLGGHILKLQGSPHDMAGKVMALKAYGRLTPECLEKTKLECHTYDMGIEGIRDLWNLEYIERLIHQGEEEDHKVLDQIQFCHSVTEDTLVNHFVKSSRPNDTILYSGGVALNTIVNSKIKKVRPNLNIIPHCADEGLTLGIVEWLRRQWKQPEFDRSGFPFWQDDEAPAERPSPKTITQVAEYIADGRIVGWYQGHGELGPRALGNRSILMRPDLADGKEFLNKRVKHREWFRPFGASVIEDKVSDYFVWEGKSDYMLYCMDVRDPETFKSITHADGTCRPQTVGEDKEDYYDLISVFEELTGLPMVLNTSLNNGGKPIAGRVSDALQLLHDTDLDVLCVGDTIYTK